MKEIRLTNKVTKTFQGNSRGFSLIEVLVALALLGIIAVVFLGGIATASKAIFIADKRTTAESLARSQMEYVKNQDYIIAPEGDEATYQKITGIPDGYTIWSVNRADVTVNGDDDDDIIAVPWAPDPDDPDGGEPVDEDVGLQRIKLVIKHQGKDVITLEDYKVKR